MMLHPEDVYQDSSQRVARGLGLASEFRRRGEDVKLVYSLKPDTIPVEEARNRQEFSFETIPLIRHSTTYMKKIQDFARLAEWADVIYFQSALPHVATVALAASYLTRKPVHCDWDEWDSENLGAASMRRATRWPLLAAERAIPRLADSVSVSSSELRDLVLSRGANPDWVVHAPTGVDIKQFSPVADGGPVRRELGLSGKIVYFMGRPEHTALFLRMGLAMDVNIKDVTALLSGEVGTMGPLVEKYTGDRRAVFAGPVGRFGLPAILAAATVVVVVYSDTAADRARPPLEVVQAMAIGKPIVASAVGEVPGVLGDAGFQALPSDFMGHVRAIETVLQEPAHAREVAARARVAAQDHGHWGGGAGRVLDLLSQVLEEWRIRRFGPGGPPRAPVGPPEVPAPLRDDAMSKVTRLVKQNLDLVGALEGRHSFTGPRMVQLDVTNACNNDCIACWSFSPLLADKAMPHADRGKSIPLARLIGLVDELAGMGTREIYLAGGGDPWMYPQLLDLLAHIKARGLAVTIHTNFSNVDKAKAARVVELGVDNLTVSLWAATARTYTHSHPNKAEETFERVVATLSHLCKLRGGRRQPFVKLYNVISKLNAHEFPLMHDFARDIGADAIEFAPVDTIPGRTECLLFDEADRKRLHEQCRQMQEKNAACGGRPELFDFDVFVNRIADPGTVAGLHDEKNLSVLPCTIGFHFARIMADGSVTPCMKGDKIPLGNIFERSFTEIWGGQQHRWFREKASLIPRSDPFFSLIGKDPGARVGCYKSCDDIGRNRFVHDRLQRLTFTERMILQAAGPMLRMMGRTV
ncbi:MAG: radical SAM protein [Candidatus Wallbacteria bacterium]|nr:radical SAM protein [Candidatus Wallbacteria bacterium]